MTGRGHRGTRSASREQASSPPAPTAPRGATVSQSPPQRSTRNTRAASQDLDDIQNEIPERQSTRGLRQTGVESVGSTSRTTRRQNQARSIDLATVDEVQESQSSDASEIDEQRVINESTGVVSSPSAHESRSHSQQIISELVPSMMLTFLPDLRIEALQIIELLTAENKPVSAVMQQVRLPGTRYAVLLNKREKSFQESWEYFGGNDYYINDDYIMRAFSGDKPSAEISGIRPVLQAANLATLVKKTIVTSLDNQGAADMLQNLDGLFPTPFAGDMDQTELHDETFSLALSIRTQAAISVLQKHSEESNFDPDEILAQMFFEMPEQSDQNISAVEDAMRNGKLLKIAGADANSSESSKNTVNKRILSIHKHFFDNGSEQLEDEYVDFKALQESFPWVEFVADLTKWTRLRTGEIEAIVRENGGIESIIESVEAKLAGDDREDENNGGIAPPVPSFNFSSTMNNGRDGSENNLPPSSVRTLYKGPNSVRAMIGSSQTPASGQSASRFRTPNNRGTKPTRPATLPAKITVNMREDASRREAEASDEWTAEKAIEVHKAKSNERNKENRKPIERKRLVDRQAGAHRIEFTEEDSQVTPARSTQKRPVAEKDTSDSESDPFEEDARAVPIRENLRPQKRTKTVTQEEDEVAQAMQRNTERKQREELQVSARADVEEEEAPRSTYAEINQRSKLSAKRHAPPSTQQRVFWTEVECEQLIELIAEHGSNWATIALKGNFHHNRGQVGLKDKARNMKVDFLRSGAPLPEGFDSVALGKKEIEKVKAAGMNPYRRVGEVAGDESRDMDGNEMI